MKKYIAIGFGLAVGWYCGKIVSDTIAGSLGGASLKLIKRCTPEELWDSVVERCNKRTTYCERFTEPEKAKNPIGFVYNED